MRHHIAVLLSATLALAAGPEASYRLGSEDHIRIQVADFEEVPDKVYRLDPNGDVDVPMVGRLHAGGLTTAEFESAVAGRLKKYVKEPSVSVNVVEVHSRPVSVLGAVNTPGVHQLEGPKTLVESLSLAGGLRPDAGGVVQITRNTEWGPLPLKEARTDLSGRYSVARLDLQKITTGETPAGNIQIQPHDVISVSRADIIYVMGEVKKSGGFTLRPQESMSSIQAIALAEGFQKTAAPNRARILRTNLDGGDRKEIPLDLKSILDGKQRDVVLQSNDILVVPNNAARTVAMRTLETAIQIGTGVLIFKR